MAVFDGAFQSQLLLRSGGAARPRCDSLPRVLAPKESQECQGNKRQATDCLLPLLSMKIRTVTGASINLSEFSVLWLRYVIPCGQDWIAEVQLCDIARPKNPRGARVFVSQNPGVAILMNLAHSRGELQIKSI